MNIRQPLYTWNRTAVGNLDRLFDHDTREPQVSSLLSSQVFDNTEWFLRQRMLRLTGDIGDLIRGNVF